MPTWQFRASASARAVADVPGAIAAAKHSDAQANATKLMIIFVNFVFIVIVSFCLSFVVMAFFDCSLLSCHFWPFTVLRKIFVFLTREVWELLKTPRITRISQIGEAQMLTLSEAVKNQPPRPRERDG
jgi:hypothetical protein